MATFIDRMMRSEGLGGTSLFPLDRGPGYPYFCQKLVDASKQLAKRHIFVSTFLPSATKLQQGNIFTGVCQSFCSQRGVCLSARWGTHPRAGTPPSLQAHSLEAHPQKHTPGSTHPLEQAPPWSKIFSVSCSFSEILVKSYVGTPTWRFGTPSYIQYTIRFDNN